jgi:hypothetical protein
VLHYHGTPVTPQTVGAIVLRGRHAFVSWADPRDLGLVSDICASFAIDNGAFGAWRSGKPITDWAPYYEWAGAVLRHPACDWAVIPDVIDGNEADNDALIREWPHGLRGVPVWHLHESLDRLARLAADWPRVALGSSGEWATPGTLGWWDRMARALPVVCDSEGRPLVKLHGLRMLRPEIVSRVPLASADSTNTARNHGLDEKWAGPYEPPTLEARAVVLAERIESVQSPARWAGRPVQESLFGRVA